jgi:hypothetical protein
MLVTLLFVPWLLQDPPARTPPTDQERDRVVAQLIERVQQLEAEVRELKGQRVTPPPPEPPPSPRRPEAPSMPEMAGEPSSEFPTMHFQGFSDVSYGASDLGSGHNSFGLGQFNLFITSNLSSKVNVVAEPVLEANERNEFTFELERLLLRYTANQYFSLSAGRYHTAIGWYNTAYHHSTWLQTAIGRPFIFAFEDEGGILPIHNVGVSATGRIPSGRLRLRYIAEVGNGRASRSRLDEPTQNARDENFGKAVNFALVARPDWVRGLEAGVSAFYDRLTPAGGSRIGQTILAGHVVYQEPPFEWLNEVVVVRHAPDGSNAVDYTPAFYTQISRQFRGFRPYVRYQYINVPEADPYFADIGLMHGPSVGLRFDFATFSAIKVQYDRTMRRDAPAFNTFTSQVSFVF